MNKNEVRSTFKDQASLIREIQLADGASPCYGTAKSKFCDSPCCWRHDCFDDNSPHSGDLSSDSIVNTNIGH